MVNRERQFVRRYIENTDDLFFDCIPHPEGLLVDDYLKHLIDKISKIKKNKEYLRYFVHCDADYDGYQLFIEGERYETDEEYTDRIEDEEKREKYEREQLEKEKKIKREKLEKEKAELEKKYLKIKKELKLID